jgi:LysR family hydrogen peroxide-inducible transcriptional activator
MARATFTLRQLMCLAALADTRSFRRAAQEVGLSQPSFSAQIRALESALSLTLAERRSAGAEMTPVGRAVLTRAREVLTAAQTLADFAEGARAAPAGRIALGVSATIGPYLMPETMAALTRLAPELKLAIREAPPLDLQRELAQGRHDAILTQMSDAAAFDGEELFRERLLLMMSADHPLAVHDRVPPEALAGRAVLTLDSRHLLHDQVARLCETFGAHVSADYEGASLDALRRMTARSQGLAFAPELYIRSEAPAGGDVVARPLARRTLQRRIGLMWRRSNADPAALRLVAQAARSAFAALIARAA